MIQRICYKGTVGGRKMYANWGFSVNFQNSGTATTRVTSESVLICFSDCNFRDKTAVMLPLSLLNNVLLT